MSSTRINRQWCVARRPEGNVVAGDFEYRETPIGDPFDGEVLLETLYLNLAPVMRMYMSGVSAAGEKPLAIGDVIHGRGVARVLASRHPDYREGDVVHGQIGWQTHKVSRMTAQERMRRIADRGLSYSLSLGVLGMTGYSAYFGLIHHGRPRRGDRVVVSGAAGGVGSIVIQIAKTLGCHVTGIAGGPAKCDAIDRWCDETIDYRNEDVRERIGTLHPDGIDVYFDNVGGDTLSICLDNLAMHARIVQCGSISEYLLPEPYGLTNYTRLRSKNASMNGFFVYNHTHQFDEADQALGDWVSRGAVEPMEHIVDGFESMPEGLAGMYSHKNMGASLCRVQRGPYDIAD